ncbi:MAG: hypothetical protein WBW59_06725 [Pseudolabrys sp.]
MSIPDPVFRPAFNITRASHVVHRVRDLAKSALSMSTRLASW